MRRNLCMIVSYDGSAYSGFQSQPSGNTIQNKLEDAIAMLTGVKTHVTGSGRTDAGVHARKMTANFYTTSRIPIERWAVALNSRLPNDIVVHAVQEVPESFHARRHAIRKTYRYTINCCKFPNPFRRHYEFHHPTPLDIEAMRSGLQYLIGEHDYTSFTSPLSTKPHHIRTVTDVRLVGERLADEVPTTNLAFAEQSDSTLDPFDKLRYPGKSRGLYHLYITGNGFLYQMVRIIVGTIMQVGEGKRAPEEIAAILAAKDRSKAGPTAMPHGLMLWDIEYESIK